MSEMHFFSPPVVTLGPSRAPLIASLSVGTRGGECLRVRIKQNDDVWTVTFPVSEGSYLLLGFHPSGTAEITVQLSGQAGTVTWPETLHLELQDVPTCPLEMPPFRTHKCDPDRMAGNFTFLTVRRRAVGRIPDMTMALRRWFTTWGMLVAIDNHGRVRWLTHLDKRYAGIENQ
ncbi:MAG: hypothetical protein OXJ64_07965 [Boseongicola sp.]|nr:hypothetical protein [Boseongicola sp.]